jgi:hypothetical protein
MAAEYQDPDWRVVDYQAYCLDEDVIDPSIRRPLHIRGPRPDHLEKGEYFVCLGAAQTFGRFCERPFPSILAERLNIPVLNISHGGAGPTFFQRNERLLSYLNDSCFVVLQVMSGRSESNSLFESDGVGFYRRRRDGQEIGCDQAFAELLKTESRPALMAIVEETRQSWISNYRKLMSSIRTPKVLFWFSTRSPHYVESFGSLSGLFGPFPQLVNLKMMDELRHHCDRYVECVSKKGLPQLLLDRFTGERVTITDPWTSQPWSENWYYPSPQMHEHAADVLQATCHDLLKANGHLFSDGRVRAGSR